MVSHRTERVQVWATSEKARVLGVHRLGLSLRRRGGERRVRTPHALED